MELTYIRDATQIGSKHDFSAGLIIGGKDFSVEQGHIGKMNILICTPGVEGGLRRVKMREFANRTVSCAWELHQHALSLDANRPYSPDRTEKNSESLSGVREIFSSSLRAGTMTDHTSRIWTVISGRVELRVCLEASTRLLTCDPCPAVRCRSAIAAYGRVVRV